MPPGRLALVNAEAREEALLSPSPEVDGSMGTHWAQLERILHLVPSIIFKSNF